MTIHIANPSASHVVPFPGGVPMDEPEASARDAAAFMSPAAAQALLAAAKASDRPLTEEECAVIEADANAAAEAGPDPELLPPPLTETGHAFVSRAELAAAVAVAVRTVERRNSIPILSNLRLRGTGAALMVEATDLDSVISVPVSGQAGADFVTTLPAHALHDLLRKATLADNIALDMRREISWRQPYAYESTKKPQRMVTEKVTLKLGADLRVTMDGQHPSDWPELKRERDWSHRFTLPADELARAFGRVQGCISQEESRYYLNGAFLHVIAPNGVARYNGAHGTLRIVATDGHRLGQVELPAPEGSTDMPGVIVQSKTVAELLRLCKPKGAPDTVAVRLNGQQIEFAIGDVTVRAKLIDGTYPDYARVVPLGNDKRLVADKAELIKAVKQVTVISSERGRAVKLSLTAGRLKLSVVNPDMGRADAAIEVDYDGDPLDIGFNSHYLLDLLSEIDGPCVELMLADPGSPTLIRGNGNNSELFVLMPMRV